ncbi:MAG: energy-coupling factor transporter transmembrane component T [Eubacteriales bacterium]|nr:energy-coupling factor transporter transmembrane component T [Eubacteriales bacterium]
MKDTFSTYHPVLNMIFFAGVMGVTMFVTHPLILGISLFSGICYSALLKGWKITIRNNLILTLPVMIIAAAMNPLFNHYGVTTLGYLPNGNPFTLESCVYGLVMALMLAGVITWFSCYTEVMTSDKFIYLFGKMIPALSLVLSMALRFLPRFSRQAGVIANGQKCIGRSTENGSLIKRVKHGITIFSILVTWALENAIDTADSMKCRGYGEKGRSAFAIFHFDKRDGICLTAMTVTFAGVLIGAMKGYTFSRYNPRIVVEGLPLNLKSTLVFACFFLFSMMPVILELVDRVMWERRRNQTDGKMIGGYRLWETF